MAALHSRLSRIGRDIGGRSRGIETGRLPLPQFTPPPYTRETRMWDVGDEPMMFDTIRQRQRQRQRQRPLIPLNDTERLSEPVAMGPFDDLTLHGLGNLRLDSGRPSVPFLPVQLEVFFSSHLHLTRYVSGDGDCFFHAIVEMMNDAYRHNADHRLFMQNMGGLNLHFQTSVSDLRARLFGYVRDAVGDFPAGADPPAEDSWVYRIFTEFSRHAEYSREQQQAQVAADEARAGGKGDPRVTEAESMYYQMEFVRQANNHTAVEISMCAALATMANVVVTAYSYVRAGGQHQAESAFMSSWRCIRFVPGAAGVEFMPTTGTTVWPMDGVKILIKDGHYWAVVPMAVPKVPTDGLLLGNHPLNVKLVRDALQKCLTKARNHEAGFRYTLPLYMPWHDDDFCARALPYKGVTARHKHNHTTSYGVYVYFNAEDGRFVRGNVLGDMPCVEYTGLEHIQANEIVHLGLGVWGMTLSVEEQMAMRMCHLFMDGVVHLKGANPVRVHD